MRLASQMADAFGLGDFKKEIVEGSIEPDQRRTVVHTWKKSRRVARAHFYRARRAFLRNRPARCAREMGIVSHFIADGMVHGTMDNFSHSEDHSTVEGDIGSRSDFNPNLSVPETSNLLDGEFAFREIDALVREGLSPATLNSALNLLGSAVLVSPEPPEEVVESNLNFSRRIAGAPFRVLGAAALAAAGIGWLALGEPLGLLLLPFSGLLAGNPVIFRFLVRWGWALPAAAALGFLSTVDAAPEWGILALAGAAGGIWIYLAGIPDLAKWGVRWYRMPRREKFPRGKNR